MAQEFAPMIDPVTGKLNPESFFGFRKDARRALLLQRISRFAMAIAVLVGMVAYFQILTIATFRAPQWAVGYTMFLWPIFGALGFAMYFQDKRIKARLAGLEDPRLVGFLAEIAICDPGLRGLAERSLARVLSDVTADHEAYIDPFQRHCIYRLLHEPNPLMRTFAYKTDSLTHALLRVIHLIGGGEAVPYLESFVNEKRKSKEDSWKRLADYARVALADVRMRAAKRIIDDRVAEIDRLRMRDEFRMSHMSAGGSESNPIGESETVVSTEVS